MASARWRTGSPSDSLKFRIGWGRAAGLVLAGGALVVAVSAAKAVEVTTPQQLNYNDTYRLDPDGATGDEDTTCPKTDANDGQSGDNPYFQRTNVARAHLGGCPERYWYTSQYRMLCTDNPPVNTCPGYPCIDEPDPNGDQWVDYVPPFGPGADQLTPGRYLINAQYRYTESRPTYPAQYIVHHAGGTTTIPQSQREGTLGACESFDLGTFDMDSGSYIRVEDTGSGSITFNRMKYTYLGPLGGVPYVDAGLNQTIILPDPADLDGTADDDGQPGPLTTTWSKFSGPGTVNFGDENAVDTTVSFSVAGTYVLRLTATDTLNIVSDDVGIEVLPEGSSYTYSTQYEFDDPTDPDPSTATGVIDADGGDANGDGLLTKVGTGTGDAGSGISNGALHFIDSSTDANHGYFWAANSNISFTMDLSVKANDGVDGTLGRRSMGFSAGAGMNRGLRLNQPGGSCTVGGVQFNAENGGQGSEGCTDLTGFRRLRVTLNSATNMFRVFDLDGGVELTNTTGGGSGPAAEIVDLGGFHIGSISKTYTTLTDYELDYVRILLGLAVEDATTVIQSLVTCGASVTPVTMQTSTAITPEAPEPDHVDYTVSNTGQQQITYTVSEVNQAGDPVDHPWLSLDKGGATLPPLATDVVAASIDATGLAVDVYNGYLKFVADCTPPIIETRHIQLTVLGCALELDTECVVYRPYFLDYPSMVMKDVVYTVENLASVQSMDYTAQEVDGGGIATDYGWLSLDKSGGTIAALGSETVTASITPAPEWTTTQTHWAYIKFTPTNCGNAEARTGQIAVQVWEAGEAFVWEYHGDVDPTSADSAGPAGSGLQFDIADGTMNGSVDSDPDAIDGLAWRIIDVDEQKVKFGAIAALRPDPTPLMRGRVGATVVGRVRVRSHADPREGGLYIWDDPDFSCTYHIGQDAVVQEIRRSPGGEAPVVFTEADMQKFHILRMTAIGGTQCARTIRLYLDEDVDPTPIMEVTNASQQGAWPDAPEGIGFGAGSTPGSYDISFDWVTGTNAGAYAPGEEVDVLGRSLLPEPCNDPFADDDDDGDVDQADFAAFQRCYTGTDDPGGAFDPQECFCFDRDDDNDVDEADYSKFEACATGPDIPWSSTPECP